MRLLWCWVLLEKGMNICELMGMGIYELKKELISESRGENSKIDGDFERISSLLMGKWFFPFIVKLREQLAKAKNIGFNQQENFQNIQFGQKCCELIFECLSRLGNFR